ncbi:PLP-dependent transferase [Marinifilum caeruleilacunae]|uniref:PLP-dependent transferase n=1 Tax=Marinifilum caeruleilacunae TaxID=2499076 RepID=A0ABX1WSV5_9BACT|nr:PLP-dependent transferase [Marinifilum caeruleilacunae]NOU59187.1 PLP-dependent transferase [Marinifilum caeruleilacunae]
MKQNIYGNIECGKSIPPDNIHAISVSLPRISDVISYEENQNNWRECMESGYPRFFQHPLEVKAIKLFRSHFSIPLQQEIVLLPNAIAKNEMIQNCKLIDFKEYSLGNLFAVAINKNKVDEVKAFVQHTGYKSFTRQLEQFLYDHSELSELSPEVSFRIEPENHIKKVVRESFEISKSDAVYLFSCGMNAIYSLFRSLQKVQASRNAPIFIQFGWLYTDTMQILSKYADEKFEIVSVFDTESLLKYVGQNNGQIAAIFTEMPTNPILNTPDLPLIYEKLRKLDIPLVVDGTIGTCINLNYLAHCDYAVESLTKFASGMADVMSGVVVPNPLSKWVNRNNLDLLAFQNPMYIKDAERLAFEINGFKERVERIRSNTVQLALYFETHPLISKVNWSHNATNKANYTKLEKKEENYAGLISIEFNTGIEAFYDALELAKGPSLGTEFTLVMPYFYLAHYDLISTSEGRQFLQEKNINWKMIRISVGIEPIEELIQTFDKALKQLKEKAASNS